MQKQREERKILEDFCFRSTHPRSEHYVFYDMIEGPLIVIGESRGECVRRLRCGHIIPCTEDYKLEKGTICQYQMFTPYKFDT